MKYDNMLYHFHQRIFLKLFPKALPVPNFINQLIPSSAAHMSVGMETFTGPL